MILIPLPIKGCLCDGEWRGWPGQKEDEAISSGLTGCCCIWFDWWPWVVQALPLSALGHISAICCCLLLDHFSLCAWCTGPWHTGQLTHLNSTLWLTGRSTKVPGVLASLYGPLAFTLLWHCAKAAERYKLAARWGKKQSQNATDHRGNRKKREKGRSQGIYSSWIVVPEVTLISNRNLRKNKNLRRLSSPPSCPKQNQLQN